MVSQKKICFFYIFLDIFSVYIIFLRAYLSGYYEVFKRFLIAYFDDYKY